MAEPDQGARIAANKAHWDDRAEIHARSRYYDLDSVVTYGPRPIVGPDEEELAPVDGRSLLHLHCHIGTDTLRWAALEADVTGVDLSPRSIEIARSLSERLGIPARFIDCDIDLLPAMLNERYDIVYASYGVLCWVPDITRWARTAAHFAKPGGIVYVAEGHPFDVAFDPARFGRASYFDRGPRQFEDGRSYTETGDPISRPINHRWSHTLGDVVTAFATAELRIEFLHEHPRPPRADDDATGVTERRSRVPPGAPGLFSLKATKPSEDT